MPTDPDPIRIAVVTGASRGIGKAIALSQAAQGRHVVLLSRSEGPLCEVRSQIESSGGRASIAPVDVSDAVALQSVIEDIIKEFGHLDVLINNAGVTRDGLALRMSTDDFEFVLKTNLTSAFVAIRSAARAMMKNRFGRIVNISSTSGVVGNAGQANYAASKAGLVGLTRSIARELGGKGITANVIAPGFVLTDMTANLGETIRSKVLASMAIKRLGSPEDIAQAVEYVASDEAGYLTGQVICVDGGLTMC